MNMPADQMLLAILINIGWIPLAAVLVAGGWMLWVDHRQGMYARTIRYTLLAIDVPRGNDVSMRQVENLFTYLGGAHEEPDLIEKYWHGMFQLGFSFEIISIEGYIQYLIRTPDVYRDIVESAIYSTYPDAEITEVNDYTEGFPTKFPDDEYNIWGGEFIQVKRQIYPIRTYREFEHQMGKPETYFKDPIAALMDLYTSMKKGENMWLQFIVYPTGFDWPNDGIDEINKIVGDKSGSKKQTTAQKILNFPIKLIELFNEIILGWAPADQSKDEVGYNILNLKPRERKQIDSIQMKISKLGFGCKIRFAYVARKEAWNRPKGIGGLIGWIKQFADLDLNNLKPDMKVTATTAHYFFVDWRKNTKRTKLMSAYKDRTGTRGRKRFILTTDELATLWHFPIESVVKAPMLQKATGRKAEPPSSLPIETGGTAPELFETPARREDIFAEVSSGAGEQRREDSKREDIFAEEETEASPRTEVKAKGSAPSNLPFADE